MERLTSILVDYYAKHPFRAILFVALLVRLMAFMFLKGYAMMDDHYLLNSMKNLFSDIKLDTIIYPSFY